MIKRACGVVQNRLRRCDCKAKEIDVFEQASMKARLIRVVLQRAVTGHKKYPAAVLQAVQPQVELREMQFGSEVDGLIVYKTLKTKRQTNWEAERSARTDSVARVALDTSAAVGGQTVAVIHCEDVIMIQLI